MDAPVPTADSEKRDSRGLLAFGRLAEGATLADARAEMDVVARRLEKTYPKTNEGVGVVVKPYNDQFNGGPIRTVFLALLGAVGFVLLIACANVANLLLARSIARTKEVAIRSALGASRWRVVRQLLIESVLLGVSGGVAGLVLSIWGVRMFDRAVANVGKPYWINFSMDFAVFGYLAAICLTTGILFGLAPALQVSKVDINEILKEGGRGSSGSSRVKYLAGFLVVSEVALSLVLLVGAGLMIRSFLKMYGMQAGIDAGRLLTMRLNLVDSRYPTPETRVAFYERLRPRLESVPGVESVAFASSLPIGGSFGWRFEIEGQPPVEPDKRPSVSGLVISPDYFQVMGMRILRGRSFTDTDGTTGKTAVIVNQPFVAKYWPGEEPLGKRLRLVREGEQPWLTVVGVCPDIRQNDPTRAEVDPAIYVPYRQDPARGFAIVARGRVAASSLGAALRKEVQAVDEALPVFSVQTLQEFFIQARWPFRVFGTLFAIFAVIALVLSSVGIYANYARIIGSMTRPPMSVSFLKRPACR